MKQMEELIHIYNKLEFDKLKVCKLTNGLFKNRFSRKYSLMP